VFYPKTKSKVSGADRVAQAREAGVTAASRARDATSAAAQTAAQRATQVAAQSAQSASQTAQIAAQSAAQTAQAAAQTAAQAASTAAQTAAQVTGKSVRQGVYSARGWAAPRLENAADFTTATVAPKVSSALRGTARQISPGPTRRKKGLWSVLRWSLLATAALAAGGAAALLVRQRYRAAMAADTEEDSAPVGPGAATPAGTDATRPGREPAGTESATPASPAPADGPPADTGVNGRVSASG
jgi:trimeric autotransporter adhesin